MDTRYNETELALIKLFIQMDKLADEFPNPITVKTVAHTQAMVVDQFEELCGLNDTDQILAFYGLTYLKENPLWNNSLN